MISIFYIVERLIRPKNRKPYWQRVRAAPPTSWQSSWHDVEEAQRIARGYAGRWPVRLGEITIGAHEPDERGLTVTERYFDL